MSEQPAEPSREVSIVLDEGVESIFHAPDANELLARVVKMIQTAVQYGNIDGGHHKMWVINEMLRAVMGEDDLKALIDAYTAPDTDGDYYFWDEGIAP